MKGMFSSLQTCFKAHHVRLRVPTLIFSNEKKYFSRRLCNVNKIYFILIIIKNIHDHMKTIYIQTHFNSVSNVVVYIKEATFFRKHSTDFFIPKLIC